MRHPLVLALALACLAPAALAQEAKKEAASNPPLVADSMKDYFSSVPQEEVYIPIRGQYFTTRGGHAWGNWNASYFAGETLSFDDNLYLTDKKTEDSFISATTLGMRLSRDGAKVGMDMTAALTESLYTQDASDNDNLSGYFNLGALYGLDKGAFLRFSERFLARKDAIGSTSSAPGGPVLVTSSELVRMYDNLTGATVGFRADAYAIEFTYTNLYQNYGRTLDSMDATEHRGNMTVRHTSSPKLEVNGQLEGRWVGYRERINNDFSTGALYAGARWVTTPKVTIEGRVGFLSQDSSTSGTVPDTSEYQGGVGSVSALWAATPKVFVDVVASRDIYTASGSNFQLIHLVGAGVRWDLEKKWLARARFTAQDSRNSGGPDGRYFTPEVGLTYRPSEWWEASLLLQHQRFAGDAGGSDYVDNRIGVQVSLLF